MKSLNINKLRKAEARNHVDWLSNCVYFMHFKTPSRQIIQPHETTARVIEKLQKVVLRVCLIPLCQRKVQDILEKKIRFTENVLQNVFEIVLSIQSHLDGKKNKMSSIPEESRKHFATAPDIPAYLRKRYANI